MTTQQVAAAFQESLTKKMLSQQMARMDAYTAFKSKGLPAPDVAKLDEPGAVYPLDRAYPVEVVTPNPFRRALEMKHPRNELAETKAQAQKLLAQDEVDWPAYEVAVDRILELEPTYGEPEDFKVEKLKSDKISRWVMPPWISFVFLLAGIAVFAVAVFSGAPPVATVMASGMIGLSYLWTAEW